MTAHSSSLMRTQPRRDLLQAGLRFVCGLILAMAPGVAFSWGSYGGHFDTKYNTQGKAIAGNACTVCHTPYPARNAYGSAFAQSFTTDLRKANNVAQALADIEALDSDGDGVTNIGEIADLKFPGNLTDTPPSTVLPGAPTGVSGAAGNSQVTVSFTAPALNGGSAITSYTVTAFPGGASATGSASPITVTGLANGTEYTFTVKAKSVWGIGAASAASSGVAPVMPPSVPVSVSAVAGNGQATVSFVEPGGGSGSGYTVTSSPGGLTATGPSLSIVISGLTNGTAYSFTVRITSGGTASAASNTVTPSASGATVPNAPGTPFGVTNGDRMGLIAFPIPQSNGSPITRYTVACNYTPTGGVLLNFTIDSPTRLFVITGLNNGTTYRCSSVTATNAVGTSAATTIDAQFVPFGLSRPGVPTSVVAVPGDGRATLSFGPPTTDGGSAVSGYTAYCLAGSNSGPASPLNATGTASPLTVTGLTNGTAYACWVAASNANGAFNELVNYGDPVSVTPTGVVIPEAPAGVTGTLSSSNNVVMSWSAVTGATSYNIYMANASGVNKANYSSLAGGHVHSLATSPYTHPSGTPGATYYLSVTAANSAGESVGSSEVSVAVPSPATTTTTSATTTTTGATTTSTGGTTTTTATTTSTTLAPVSLNLVTAWNLLGNGSSGSLNVSAVFGDASMFNTVWKWIATTARWAFYAPSLGTQALIDFAASKGYDVLTTVEGGEGFWVNAKQATNAQIPAGAPVQTSALMSGGAKALSRPGFNLIAIGESRTPGQFNAGLTGMTVPASVLDTPQNLTTLWAWDATQLNWYFYAPSLVKSSGLAAYIVSKSYLDFSTNNTMLGQGVGFWVNMP